ncbi:MAG: sulfite exporter TauE/SafE family protein [Sphingobacteriales bacterium]|nr:sulfite exporter TauE/SafE family protein [Sphingobacteriales bacterium]
MTTQLIIIALLIGLAAGMLSGLVGVGGGIIMVPALVFFMNYTQHQAQGTSLAVLTLPVVIIATLHYYYECQKAGTPIDLKIVGLLCGGFVIGAFFGSKLALRIDQDTLKKIFAVILFYTAFKMLGWDSMIVKWVKGIF